ncbi:MAG: helix-turn-helix domain-containing protein, partial [Pseudomonadota bacterium]
PGNVRELRNRVERAVALMEGARLDVGDLFPDRSDKAPAASAPSRDTSNMTLDAVRQDAERRHIAAVLADNDWHMQKTAQILGISRGTLWERMQKLGLQREG